MNFNNNKKMNHEVELNNNKGEIEMNNPNIFKEEIKLLKEIVKRLEQGEELNQSQQQKHNEIIEEYKKIEDFKKHSKENHEKIMKRYGLTPEIEED